jgi:rsbT co-antagonist protein RsbR
VNSDVPDKEIGILRARVKTLEQLLVVHEETAKGVALSLEGAVAELATRNEILERVERERNALVTQLRFAIDELSIPVIEVWENVLAIPIIGVVDSRRAADVMTRVLEEVAQKGAACVIIDVTGVDLIDTATAEHFTRIVRAVELIGARCMLTGVRPAVAQAIVDLGLQFGELRTLRTLKQALRETIALERRSAV